MKKTLKTVRNIIRWTLFYLNLTVFILSICCLDSKQYLLFGAIALFSFAYLIGFYYVNYEEINKLPDR